MIRRNNKKIVLIFTAVIYVVVAAILITLYFLLDVEEYINEWQMDYGEDDGYYTSVMDEDDDMWGDDWFSGDDYNDTSNDWDVSGEDWTQSEYEYGDEDFSSMSDDSVYALEDEATGDFPDTYQDIYQDSYLDTDENDMPVESTVTEEYEDIDVEDDEIYATITCEGDATELFTLPDLNSEVVCYVFDGEMGTVLTKDSSWTKIKIDDGTIGYILNEYLLYE